MEQGNTIEVKKISEWNRLLNVKTSDIFHGLLGVVEGIMNLEAGTATRAGVEMLLGIGSEENDVLERRAYVLVYGAIRQALVQLVLDNNDLFGRYCNRAYGLATFEKFGKKLDASIDDRNLEINYRFFSHPDQFALTELIRPIFEEWMTNQGIPKEVAIPVGARIKFYFVRKLNEIWKSKPDYFKDLEADLTERFQLDRVRGRYNYNQSLIERWSERMFDEAFGLDAVYVPLNGCHPLPRKNEERDKEIHIVVDAEKHIMDWLEDPAPKFQTLVLRGGPGSGKSSLMKKVAMELAGIAQRNVYFVQLQWFPISLGFEAGIRSVIEKNVYLSSEENPFDPKGVGMFCKSVFIFDGLDELNRSGSLGQSIATTFVTQLATTFNEYNNRPGWDLRAIVTGRDFIVQKEVEDTHKKQGQVLELLPYFFVNREEEWRSYAFHDPEQRLSKDLRVDWWNRFWEAKDPTCSGVPNLIQHEDYRSLSCQPLLSYLLAKAYSKKLIDSSTQADVNTVYERLIDSLRERPWGGKSGHVHTTLKREPFFHVLEEMAITAWHRHNDVRVTSLKAFEERCTLLGMNGLIADFKKGNQSNANDLVISFFARSQGKDDQGADLVEFTHKSFGEYLVARRIVRLAKDIQEGMLNPKFYKHDNAKADWLATCSQSELTEYIWPFLERQVALEYQEQKGEAAKIQKTLADLLSEFLNTGFKLTGFENSLEVVEKGRNAEASLLLLISAFARVSTEKTIVKWNGVDQPRRIIMETSELVINQGLFGMKFPKATNFQFVHFKSRDISRPMSQMSLAGTMPNFTNAEFELVDLGGAILDRAILKNANLKGAELFGTSLAKADLSFADFSGAEFFLTELGGANLKHANFLLADVQCLMVDGKELWGKGVARYLTNAGALNVPKPKGMK